MTATVNLRNSRAAIDLTGLPSSEEVFKRSGKRESFLRRQRKLTSDVALHHLFPTMMSGCGEEERFEPSGLGTKEHWDAAYEQELHNFKESGDTGDIWFGEESMTRIIRWLEKQKIPLDTSVLDIGTGNGILLVELSKSGYTNLTGVDYSPSAIQLSKNIIQKEGLPYIKLLICIDKGTFDAISLSPDNAAEKRKQYVKSLQRLLRSNGFFLITSCNWTKEELCKQFEGFLLLEEELEVL